MRSPAEFEATTGPLGQLGDLDFLVELRRPSFDDYMETKFFLEDLFGRPVDLVTDKALKPALQHVRTEAAYAAGF